MNELPTVLSVAVLATLSVAVGMLMNVLKPFIEMIPGLGPNDANHDAVIRLCTLLLTIGAALGYAAAQGTLTSANIVYLALQVVLQYGTSLGVYHSYNTKSSGTGSGSADDTSSSPASVTPATQASPVATIDQARLAAVIAEAEAAASAAVQAARSAKAA